MMYDDMVTLYRHKIITGCYVTVGKIVPVFGSLFAVVGRGIPENVRDTGIV